jgi:hypothetical protein
MILKRHFLCCFIQKQTKKRAQRRYNSCFLLQKVFHNKISSFTNSLVNIFRLNCFKSVPGVIKQIKKPTPKNINSKRTLKLKQKVQMRKMRKLKKNEKKIQRKLAKKEPKKMEIETK